MIIIYIIVYFISFGITYGVVIMTHPNYNISTGCPNDMDDCPTYCSPNDVGCGNNKKMLCYSQHLGICILPPLITASIICGFITVCMIFYMSQELKYLTSHDTTKQVIDAKGNIDVSSDSFTSLSSDSELDSLSMDDEIGNESNSTKKIDY